MTEILQHSKSLTQGELFTLPSRPSTVRAYRGTVASRVAGITYRQLDYWARRRILEPSITPSNGSGSLRLYSFKDIVILAVSKKLLDVGVNLQTVTAAVQFLMKKSMEDLADTTIVCNGRTVRECANGDQLFELLGRGEALFAICARGVWHSTATALEHEPFEELDEAQLRRISGTGDNRNQSIAASRDQRRLSHRSIAKAQTKRPNYDHHK